MRLKQPLNGALVGAAGDSCLLLQGMQSAMAVRMEHSEVGALVIASVFAPYDVMDMPARIARDQLFAFRAALMLSPPYRDQWLVATSKGA